MEERKAIVFKKIDHPNGVKFYGFVFNSATSLTQEEKDQGIYP